MGEEAVMDNSLAGAEMEALRTRHMAEEAALHERQKAEMQAIIDRLSEGPWAEQDAASRDARVHSYVVAYGLSVRCACRGSATCSPLAPCCKPMKFLRAYRWEAKRRMSPPQLAHIEALEMIEREGAKR